MRVTVGAIAVLGLAVTVAVAQPPVRERAAVLKPPEVLPPEEIPIARGAIDDTTVAGAQARVVVGSFDELDPRSDRHTGPKPGGEEPCALGIHTTHIGFEGRSL